MNKQQKKLIEWASDPACPGWLIDRLQEAAEEESAWLQAVAAGTAARHWPVGDPSALKSALLSADADALSEFGPHESLYWVAGLQACDQEWLEDAAVREADNVRYYIGEALGDPDQIGWKRLLLRRDALESVAILLREAGAADRLLPVLRELDKDGEAWLAGEAPAWNTLCHVDERALARALEASPGDWWSAPALWAVRQTPQRLETAQAIRSLCDGPRLTLKRARLLLPLLPPEHKAAVWSMRGHGLSRIAPYVAHDLRVWGLAMGEEGAHRLTRSGGLVVQAMREAGLC